MLLSTRKQTAALKKKRNWEIPTGKSVFSDDQIPVVWISCTSVFLSLFKLCVNTVSKIIWRSTGKSQHMCELVAMANFSMRCIFVVQGHRAAWPFLCMLMERALSCVSFSSYEDTNLMELEPHPYYLILS